MLSDVVHLLRCPHCGDPLELHERALRCPRGHSFDVARQGYVNLLRGRAATGSGDTAAMVEARAAFLATGHFDRFAAGVTATLAEEGVAAVSPVAEIGAGTAYYLAHLLRGRAGPGVALDVSVYAARRAARAHERIGAVVADAWTHLPLADGCLGAALVAFAPRSGGELGRVVAPGGRLVVLTPGTDHLRELRRTLGLLDVDPRKDERLEASLGGDFDVVGRRALRWTTELDHGAVTNLVLMGPNARHRDADELASAVAALPEAVPVTVSGVVHVLRRR